MFILQVLDQNIKISLAIVKTRDKKDLCRDLEIPSTIGKLNGKILLALYQSDASCPQMGRVKLEVM